MTVMLLSSSGHGQNGFESQVDTVLSDVGVYLSWLNSNFNTGILTRMVTVYLYKDLKI